MNAYKEAIMAYNRALELCPYYSDCYFNLGNIYFENGAIISEEE
jgi:tetratricopeptide (TPR) repeat protein